MPIKLKVVSNGAMVPSEVLQGIILSGEMGQSELVNLCSVNIAQREVCEGLAPMYWKQASENHCPERTSEWAEANPLCDNLECYTELPFCVSKSSMLRLQSWLKSLGKDYSIEELGSLKKLTLSGFFIKKLKSLTKEIGNLTTLQE